jgi:tetratricopeptide (TPR) repeat protein
VRLAAVAAGVLLAACSTDTGPEVTPTATAVSVPTATPEPTATTEPSPAPEPTRPPTTENVRQYANAHAFLSRDQYIEAERRFTIVVETEPEFARGWEGRGSARFGKGDVEGAIEDFTRAIELKPNLAEAFSGRAVARLSAGDVLGANQDAVRTRELDPLDPNPLVVLGRILSMSRRFTDALEMFNEAVDLAPMDGPAYWWRGRFLYDYGNFELALGDFDRAIQLSPVAAQPYLDRAQVLMEFSDGLEAARADIEEAISLARDPKLPDVLDAADLLLERLEAQAAAGG